MYVCNTSYSGAILPFCTCVAQKSRKTPGSTKGKSQKSGVVGTSEATGDVPHPIKIDPLVTYNVLMYVPTYKRTAHTYTVRTHTVCMFVHTVHAYLLCTNVYAYVIDLSWIRKNTWVCICTYVLMYDCTTVP